MFYHSEDQLQQLSHQVLSLAKKQGATAVELDISESLGQNVQVRQQDVEQIEYQQDKSLDITVFVGKAKGRASTADFSQQAVSEVVKAAMNIASYTAQDDCSGLADAALMAENIEDTDSFHPWPITVEAAIDLAKISEKAALDFDQRIINSEGAGVQTEHYQYIYANSHGFSAYQKGSRHHISCSVVA